MSHPVWVRGLKLFKMRSNLMFIMSHPVWVRGLKLIIPKVLLRMFVSHPVWVRGLKQIKFINTINIIIVAPRVGAWIETHILGQGKRCFGVAPRVGAWIETTAEYE